MSNTERGEKRRFVFATAAAALGRVLGDLATRLLHH